MAWKERKGFLHLFICFTGGDRFVDQFARKSGRRVGWSDAAGAARLRNKSVPLYFRNSASQTFLNRVVLISLYSRNFFPPCPYRNSDVHKHFSFMPQKLY
jgi:hypothetical protein